MRDEEYVFFQDVREKKVTGYSARKQRSHCGKAGCKLPSDHLSKKEILNMSGECKSYRLNEPMTFAQFKAMPDDLQAVYVKALREKYNVSDSQLAKMFGASQAGVSQYLRKKGLNRSGAFSGKEEWDKEGFYAWAYGIPKKEEAQSVQEEESVTATEEAEQEIPCEMVEEETPVVEEVSCDMEGTPCQDASGQESEGVIQFKKCIPTTGSMTYEGLTFNILSSLADLLGNANVVLSVKWDVLEVCND